MSRPTPIATEAQQGYTFSRRAWLLGAAQIGVGTVLAGRMGWLAIAENEHYKLLSESNRINMTLIPPRRGWLVDRHGHAIADNRTDFRVDLIPDRVVDKDRTLAALRELLALTDEDMLRIREDLKQAAGFQPVKVAENVGWERFAAVQVRQPELPGVAPTRGGGVRHERAALRAVHRPARQRVANRVRRGLGDSPGRAVSGVVPSLSTFARARDGKRIPFKKVEERG